MISNMTQEDYDKVEQHWKEIGLLSITSGAHSAEDENIPFSRWDKCYTTTYKYKERPDEVHERLERVSKYFQWADDILTSWGYELDINHKTGYLENSFYYRHPEPLIDSICICMNCFHKELFKITHVFGVSDSYVKVKTKPDMRSLIEGCIIYIAKRSGNLQLEREVKLKELLR